MVNNLANVLDFGMDPKRSVDTPNFRGPYFGNDPGGVQQMDLEALAEGDFAEKLVEAVIAKGQAIKRLPKAESLYQRGLWVAIQIDHKSGKRIGVSAPVSNGGIAGY
jgi:hypothetical protein